MSLPDADWLGLCRRAAAAARSAVAELAAHGRAVGRARARRGRRHDAGGRPGGRGRDLRRARGARPAADGGVRGARRGWRSAAAGPVRVVIDPVDGSMNAKRGAAVRVRVDRGGVRAPDGGRGGRLWSRSSTRGVRDWWAARGEGAWRDGERLGPLEPGPLEVLGLETARPSLVAARRGGDRGDRRPPPARARLGGRVDVPGGRRPPRRDDHTARGPLGRRGGGAADRGGGRRSGGATRGRRPGPGDALDAVAARDATMVERLLRAA